MPPRRKPSRARVAVHASEEELFLLAEDDVVWLDGSPIRELPLRPGQCLTLRGGLRLRVEAASDHRRLLQFDVQAGVVSIHEEGTEREIVLRGKAARVVRALLDARGPVRWSELAAAAWPDDASLRHRGRTGDPDDWTDADERRFRNRWDGLAVVLRRRLGSLRPGLLRIDQGVVLLDLDTRDRPPPSE